jgi:hypothetical protein
LRSFSGNRRVKFTAFSMQGNVVQRMAFFKHNRHTDHRRVAIARRYHHRAKSMAIIAINRS